MARRQKIKSLGDVPLDIFEAIKRGMIKRGIFPGGGNKVIKPKSLKHRKQNLAVLTVESDEKLYEATTVFPFVLFPDTITLDRVKLTITKRTFFRVAKSVSLQIGDIQSAESSVGPLFGALSISSKYFSPKTRSIEYLKRQDAIRIQQLLQGFIIANERKIDCSKTPKDELAALLNSLGS